MTDLNTEPHWHAAALAHLHQADPILSKAIARVAGPVRPAAHEDLYLALLRAIVSQQISTKAAAAIWRRFTALFRPDGYPEPREVLRLEEDELREAGLSRQKIGYLKAVAEYQERGLLDHEHLSQLDAEAFTAHLTAIKGVGRWTAQMLQMFALDQPDVFSEGDLGIQNAMRKLYGLEETGRALHKKMLLLAEPWRPYRSLACKYLWKSLDATPPINADLGWE
ncbi:DNA-3-methyladenine glycosylase 2 family protein [Hymenobacter sp. BRD128]|uniref:DNA-3-methyladenine glycosylase family protein n=1 Tax=Hymenobacter sp. BRD128 TaxID=2675878 RepID=UPI0015635458|nr:DNA-3-methyladenine glycosylase 2 family protein [Hymenobacter sp. BRD128]QKG56241.1 DNA-3-methyladenine glycosylase 2 family protein [Hymenobacter sp. BRD128]